MLLAVGAKCGGRGSTRCAVVFSELLKVDDLWLPGVVLDCGSWACAGG